MPKRSDYYLHDHHNAHGHPHDHDHGGEHNSWGRLKHVLSGHTHSHAPAALDPALAMSRGIRALKVSLIGLLVTAVFQVVIVALSGGLALLAIAWQR